VSKFSSSILRLIEQGHGVLFIKAVQWQALDLEVKNGIKQYNPP
jgi:hypothetical protein